MTITLGIWVIPLAVTIVMLFAMFRPLSSNSSVGPFDMSGLEALFRLFWLIPILLIWVLYLLGRLIWI